MKRPGGPRRRVVVALAAAVMLSTVACGTNGGITSHHDGSSSSAPASSAPPAGGVSTPYHWVLDRAASLGIGGGPTTSLASVLAPTPSTGALWQIAGTTTNADGTTTATIWTSPDATAWTAAPLSLPGANSQARAATTLGAKTVVVGSAGTGKTQRAAVWLSSAPGAAFRQIDAAAFAPSTTTSGSVNHPTGGDANGRADGGVTMNVVAAGGLGIFASGPVDGEDALWYSTDGLHWTRLKGAEQVIDAATNPHVNALLVGANGVYAAGSVTNGSATDASVWSSTDGITWSQVRTAQAAFTGDGDHTINGLASIGTGFVAVGDVHSGQSRSPASWVSPDGHSWSEASQSFPLSEGPRSDSSGATVNAVATDTTDTTA
ncbi:MAG: hypothetical protein M3137_07630, partial [Actinomycetota bacterium]|nr:hypothetical protein [Actinomycetota bacterium]